ncbi:SIR2-like domain-containing protein [Variovorax sp. OK605]|uniref:SIR2 family protein n=1 Tax=Variovorax sp. OK605 TaxID=1855317 RepID=UPI0008EC0753|nr:SIR2 family protein [Variovorax sp. OK605]SFQ73572.1 SIR2-like domain-containing protein [Variovorax sp. OK605]
MSVNKPQLSFHGYEVLVERVVHAPREIIFFLGSALSLPEKKGEPGVPGVGGVLEYVEAKLADSPDAFAPVRGLQDVGEAYQKAFAQLQAFRGQDAANEVIRRVVLQARKASSKTPGEMEALNSSDPEVCRKLDEDIAGWHLRPSLVALGKLLVNHSGRLGKTVLTTNFDPLVQVAVRAARGTYLRTMLHDDGTLNQSEGPGVQIVHLHGYWHSKDTLHVPTQINRPREKLKRSLERLLQNRTLIVMGCGGWDDVFMSCLSDLVSDSELNPDVVWTFHESDSQQIVQKYQHVFTKLAPGVGRGRVQFYADVDLHRFFPQLLENLQSVSGADDQRHINELLEKLGALAPELRHKILAQIDPSLIEKVESLKAIHDRLEQELVDTRHQSTERIAELEAQAARLATELQQAQMALTSSRLALTSAAIKDLSLTLIRTQMMPRQPGHVPFHNSREVALRGYHAAAGGKNVTPALSRVTWSKVPYEENGLHRGYKAALTFEGHDFVPGVVFTYRRRGEGLPAGNSDYFWNLPNIYFGDYLEVSTSDSDPESPLGWRGHEFQVKNPEGRVSGWVAFSYAFDDGLLESISTEAYRLGVSLLEAGNASEAVEPLRKAYVFSDRMLGAEAQMTIDRKAVFNRAIDDAALSKLRFRVGDRLRVVSGEQAGISGVVERLLLRHLHAYVIRSADGGQLFQASDEQVDGDQPPPA